jgi:hypothetical protein
MQIIVRDHFDVFALLLIKNVIGKDLSKCRLCQLLEMADNGYYSGKDKPNNKDESARVNQLKKIGGEERITLW